MLPPHLAHLPAPSAAAQAVSAELRNTIRAAILDSAGWVSFARYMELALYAPGLGYYSAGSVKLGETGDFVTAPELSPLFARCVAHALAPLLAQGLPDVIEIGAGSGALAAGLMESLAALGCLPERYLILEVSADLRERQLARLQAQVPSLADRVQWLEVLPSRADAVLVANEVLDAIPTHVVRKREGLIEEAGVALDASGTAFEWRYRPAQGELCEAASALALPDGYQTEINLASRAFVKSFARAIRRGTMLFIDYGFPAAELFHPQRSSGTLMCHYRHHAHDDPFALVGLQDITAHVDFSAVASAGVDAGFEVLGYTTLAQFLVNCGITDILAQTSAEEVRAYAPLASQAQKLLSPAEMGELFKVLALARGMESAPGGFARGDRAHTL